MTNPVQVLVIGFDEPAFSGEVLAELNRLRDAGIVRLIDVLLLRRDRDGSFETLPHPARADAGVGDVAAGLFGADDGPVIEDGNWSLADAVEPGGTAAVALIEHLWAGPLVDAITAAGGRPLAEGWLAPEDRERLPSETPG